MVLINALFVFLTPWFKVEDKQISSYPFFYYSMYVFLLTVGGVFNFLLYVSLGSFNAKISDKSIGGRV